MTSAGRQAGTDRQAGMQAWNECWLPRGAASHIVPARRQAATVHPCRQLTNEARFHLCQLILVAHLLPILIILHLTLLDAALPLPAAISRCSRPGQLALVWQGQVCEVMHLQGHSNRRAECFRAGDRAKAAYSNTPAACQLIHVSGAGRRRRQVLTGRADSRQPHLDGVAVALRPGGSQL